MAKEKLVSIRAHVCLLNIFITFNSDIAYTDRLRKSSCYGRREQNKPSSNDNI